MKKRTGALFVEKGLLTRTQVDEVLEHSQKTGLRFGDSALDLGFVTKHDVAQLFGAGHKVDFFYLDSKFFPNSTKDLFAPEFLIQNGILPLGTKTTRRFFSKKTTLNVGMLSPDQKGVLEIVQTAARQKNSSLVDVKPYLVITEQFLAIIESVYGLSESKVRELASHSKDNHLKSID